MAAVRHASVKKIPQPYRKARVGVTILRMSEQASQDEASPETSASAAAAPSSADAMDGQVSTEGVTTAAATSAAEAGATGDVVVEVEAPSTDAQPARVAELEAKVAQLEKEKKDTWDRLIRATADLENQRKRARRDVDDAKFDTKVRTLKEMLPVVDNLERAAEHAEKAGKEGADASMLEGIRLVLRQFHSAFERLEVQAIDALNQPFDPNLHEAISQAESDAAPGTVVSVLQRGYRTGDKLLRPSLVVVAKAKSE